MHPRFEMRQIGSRSEAFQARNATCVGAEFGKNVKMNQEVTKQSSLVAASLAALGIVYGDIGTSPLYALRECFLGGELDIDRVNVLGVLSLILWSLIIVVSLKYLIFVMRADNDGEGGILALMTLTGIRCETDSIRMPVVILLGLFGSALLYGDGMITPAISVLSAVEGLHVATDVFDHWVIPITLAILVVLFFIQKRGSAKVAKLFWPVMVVWFATLALLGVTSIAMDPTVLVAASPHYAFNFFIINGWTGLSILGTVFLVVTGGEALYADMGHFGLQPIRVAWFVVVLPALLLNYFGQGAALLSNPEIIRNPFYLLAPSWALYPLVGLSMLATVIASQAVISGAFSLTSQAVELGFLPRLSIQHTTTGERGQVYVPVVNWLLFVAVVVLVLTFRSSANLAGAYGMAVTTTMVITSLLFSFVARSKWKWGLLPSIGLVTAFLIVDLAFFGANVPKIPDGGWIPIVVATMLCVIMVTWNQGRRFVRQDNENLHLSLEELMRRIEQSSATRIGSPAVYLTPSTARAPTALVQNLSRNEAIHRTIALVTVVVDERPWVKMDDRIEYESLGNNVFRVIAHYGYRQQPNIPLMLKTEQDLKDWFIGDETTYFLSRVSFEITDRPVMANWRKSLFEFLARTSNDPSRYFQLPPDQVVEIGVRLRL